MYFETNIEIFAAMQRPIAAESRFPARSEQPLVITAHSLPPPHAAHDILASGRFSGETPQSAILIETT